AALGPLDGWGPAATTHNAETISRRRTLRRLSSPAGTFRLYGFQACGRILGAPMSRPTPAALAMARSSLPVRRVASTPMRPQAFANALQMATAAKPPMPQAP